MKQSRNTISDWLDKYGDPKIDKQVEKELEEIIIKHQREMKQSSIDWIYNNLKSHFEHDGDLLEAVKISFEQAKAMHKEEIENAYWDGGQWIPLSAYQCEDYYNETFNTKEK